MASRRQIREAAIQLLYAREASPKGTGGEALWELINDRAGLTYDKARVKILAHLQQGRPAVAKKLHSILSDCSAAIDVADASEKFAKDLASLSKNEQELAESVGNVFKLAKADLGGWRLDLHKLLLRSANLKNTRAELLPKTAPFPPQQHESIKRTFEKLDSYDERVHMVAFPGQYPEQRDLDHLHRLLKEMKKLEDEVVARVSEIETAIPDLDQVIDEAATNFDINRFSKVDLAILRLATWEIKHLADLDNAVSINEAIELARSFSGEESASFVNGLLDQIAKN